MSRNGRFELSKYVAPDPARTILKENGLSEMWSPRLSRSRFWAGFRFGMNPSMFVTSHLDESLAARTTTRPTLKSMIEAWTFTCSMNLLSSLSQTRPSKDSTHLPPASSPSCAFPCTLILSISWRRNRVRYEAVAVSLEIRNGFWPSSSSTGGTGSLPPFPRTRISTTTTTATTSKTTPPMIHFLRFDLVPPALTDTLSIESCSEGSAPLLLFPSNNSF